MECNLFTGYRRSEFIETAEGGTLFSATEYICYKNILVKVFNYLFFNLNKSMKNYEGYVESKLTQMAEVNKPAAKLPVVEKQEAVLL